MALTRPSRPCTAILAVQALSIRCAFHFSQGCPSLALQCVRQVNFVPVPSPSEAPEAWSRFPQSLHEEGDFF